jgi:hypothetical protein
MKYAVEMGSAAMIYVPISIKIGSGIQRLMVGKVSQTDAWRLHCNNCNCNKENRLGVWILSTECSYVFSCDSQNKQR